MRIHKKSTRKPKKPSKNYHSKQTRNIFGGLFFILFLLIIVVLKIEFLNRHGVLGINQTVLVVSQDASSSQPLNSGEGILTDNAHTNVWGPVSHDVYWRQGWSTIQPTTLSYNWSSIDAAITQAKAQRGKLGLRVMSYEGNLIDLPSDLRNIGNPPDWNNPRYMNAVHSLINALGNRYNNNPYFGWFEISPYGCWSEWNFSCVPSGASKTPMTPTNKNLLIQWALQAFSNKRVIMMIGGGINEGGNYDALTYALNASSKVGIRADCLGGIPSKGLPVLDYDYSLISTIAKNRWMSAPIIFEYCKRTSSQSISDFLTLSQREIQNYHASILGDGGGNIQASVQPLTNTQLIQNFKTVGFKFVPKTLTISPAILSAGSSFSIVTNWTNEGVSPVYDPWNVYLQLKNMNGIIVWQGKSSVNLQTFLPGSKTVQDNFSLPASFAAGTYELSLIVQDPFGYNLPMRLAILGWQKNGSYNIGKVVVGTKPTATPTFTPTPTKMPTPTPTPSPTPSPTPFPNSLGLSLKTGCQASTVGGAYITATWSNASGATYDLQWGYVEDTSTFSSSNKTSPSTIPNANLKGFTRVGHAAYVKVAPHASTNWSYQTVIIPGC